MSLQFSQVNYLTHEPNIISFRTDDDCGFHIAFHPVSDTQAEVYFVDEAKTMLPWPANFQIVVTMRDGTLPIQLKQSRLIEREGYYNLTFNFKVILTISPSYQQRVQLYAHRLRVHDSDDSQ